MNFGWRFVMYFAIFGLLGWLDVVNTPHPYVFAIFKPFGPLAIWIDVTCCALGGSLMITSLIAFGSWTGKKVKNRKAFGEGL